MKVMASKLCTPILLKTILNSYVARLNLQVKWQTCMSGGSSVGEKDMTVDSVLSFQAEVIVHGLAFKPGKPTLIAKAKDTVILGLPGHPVSALMVMDTIGRSILDSV